MASEEYKQFEILPQTIIENDSSEELLSINDVCSQIRVGRGKLNKMISQGEFSLTYNEKGAKRLFKSEIDKYLETHDVNAPKEVDPRNTLNDYNGTEWLPCTKSFMFQKGLGSNHKDAQIEKMHPAPYSFQDIAQLTEFFTKKGGTVLDPFVGSIIGYLAVTIFIKLKETNK